MERKAKRRRIVMQDSDKEALLENLKSNFARMCGDKELALEAATHGSTPMYMFLSRWICHNTAYPDDRTIDNGRFMGAMFAWIYYKATSKEYRRDVSENQG